jgi:non-heme Fe2+,alpha-ketoglutarate-dependent halogenase
MKRLTPEQRASYDQHGFLFPLRALAADEAGQCLADLERLESRIGAPLPRADMKWRGAAHLYAPWVNRLVRDDRILDIVEDVIGPDILVYWSTFFIKEPGGPGFTAWHQDATYFGLAPYEHVTAWVALSDASKLAGCMDVLSSAGAPRQMHHSAARLANSLNGAGQVIVEPLDDSKAVSMGLKAGELSLHHTLCCHSSAPNRADHRRVGIGISYVPARVRGTGTVRQQALLVRGSNRFDNFELLPDPVQELGAAEVAVHEGAYARFRECYYEQERLHSEQFGRAAATAH